LYRAAEREDCLRIDSDLIHAVDVFINDGFKMSDHMGSLGAQYISIAVTRQAASQTKHNCPAEELLESQKGCFMEFQAT
jgi:hypothetical protein